MPVDVLILVINDEFVKSSKFVDTVKLAVFWKVKVILVHAVDSKFPSYATISALPPDVKCVFDSIAIPYLREYADDCWTRIVAKVNNVVKVVFFKQTKITF